MQFNIIQMDGENKLNIKIQEKMLLLQMISILQKYIDRFNLTEQTYQAQVSWDKNNVQITLADGTKRAETQKKKLQ
jgi:capsid portal protein